MHKCPWLEPCPAREHGELSLSLSLPLPPSPSPLSPSTIEGAIVEGSQPMGTTCMCMYIHNVHVHVMQQTVLVASFTAGMS